MKAINNAGVRFTYNNELKQHFEELAKLMLDAKTKASDLTLKKKERKNNQKLYDQRLGGISGLCKGL